MRLLFLLVLYAALCSASSVSTQENIDILMDNVLVLRVPNRKDHAVNVSLTCGEAYQNQPVFWKKKGELMPALQGNQITVLVRELDGGNFTCHLGPDEQYLNHTVILIQIDNETYVPEILEEKSPEEGHIQCSAHNYKGSFHCNWTRARGRSNAVVLLVKAERHSQKIPCELDADGLGMQCQDVDCPFKEEQHRIILTVHVYSYARLEAYTKAFYLREIVRPNVLPNLHLGVGNVWSWSHPDSWEKPCTFFSLLFQVRVVRSDDSCDSHHPILHNTTEEPRYEVQVKSKRYVFCVRAQDKHTSGPFSGWSHCKGHKDSIKDQC